MTPSCKIVITGTIGIKPWSLYQITRSPTMRKTIFFVESSETSICPICGHPLVLRDHVKRIVKGKGGEIRWLLIRRLSCTNDKCNAIHRELPDLLAPFKHFETDIIAGVLDGLITPDTQGYQDQPSESTMKGWYRWLMLNQLVIDGTLKSTGYQVLGFTVELLTSGVSLLSELRKDTCDWLRIIIRFLYNSGSFLVSIWSQ